MSNNLLFVFILVRTPLTKFNNEQLSAVCSLNNIMKGIRNIYDKKIIQQKGIL